MGHKAGLFDTTGKDDKWYWYFYYVLMLLFVNSIVLFSVKYPKMQLYMKEEILENNGVKTA